jgi:hypothetical protein
MTIWFCANITALAQDTARLPLVGVMVTGAAAANSEEAMRPLREGLAALGGVEGRNLRLDFRFADGDAQRFSRDGGSARQRNGKRRGCVQIAACEPAAAVLLRPCVRRS